MTGDAPIGFAGCRVQGIMGNCGGAVIAREPGLASGCTPELPLQAMPLLLAFLGLSGRRDIGPRPSPFARIRLPR